MPIICMFYGVIISMCFDDHNPPHLHATYQGNKAEFRLDNGELLAGKLPKKQGRMVQTWCDIHRDELLANWELASQKKEIFRIDPLK